MEVLFSGGKVYLNGAFRGADVLTEKGKIKKIAKIIDRKNVDRRVNLKGKMLVPGFVDAHVHFRDPGFTHKEDFETGSKAALNGGVTTVYDMPNTSPPPVCVKTFELKHRAVKAKAMVDYSINGGVGPANIEDIIPLYEHGVRVFGEIFISKSVGELTLTETPAINEAFRRLERCGAVGMLHCEDQAINEYYEAKFKDYNEIHIHKIVRPVISEYVGVSKALALCGDMKTHITHVSTAAALSMVKFAQSMGENVTCDTTPNYLFLTEKDLTSTRMKFYPPMRTQQDQDALWQGLNNGTINCITTDHAPHLLEEKERGYWKSAGGLPGIETSVAFMLTAASKGRIGYERIVQLMSENPAKRFLCYPEKGIIKEGSDADLTVIDPKEKWRLKLEHLKSRCGWNPFEGREFVGRVKMTMLRSEIMMEDGEILGKRGYGKHLWGIR